MATIDIERKHERGDESTTRGSFYASLVSVVVLMVWVRPMLSSLWLDELGTWWVIQDGWREAVTRAWRYEGQSPAYYLVPWVTRMFAGHSEFALRLPSLAAACLGAYLFFRLVLRLVGDREAAWLGLLAYVSSQGIAISSSEVRPYAVALLGVVASTLALVRWLDEGRPRFGVAFVLLAAATVWVHYLFGLVLVPQALYVVARVRVRSTTIGWRAVLVAGAATALAVSLLGWPLVSLWQRRASVSIPGYGTVEGLLSVLFPLAFVGALALGGLLAALQGELRVRPRPLARQTLILLVSWLAFAPTLLFCISWVTPVTVVSPRYYVSAAPAAAVLFAVGVRLLDPPAARRVVALVLAILVVATQSVALKYGEDWKGAAAFERAHATPGSVVLLHPAFAESAQLDWFKDPERRGYLLAPLSYYPMTGHIVPLPYTIDDMDSQAYLARVASLVSGEERFFLVTRYPMVPYDAWLEGRLYQEGWTSRVLGSFGIIQVIEFTRGSPA